jgi:hypothetical protein
MGLGTIGILLGTVVLTEGVSALLEHMEGDPEADVAAALQALAARNQRRAFALQSGEVAGAEHVENLMSKFNQIPSRVLTEAALARSPQPPLGQNTSLVDMVSARLGVSPQQLDKVSHPSRTGDMSSVMRQFGKPTLRTQ